MARTGVCGVGRTGCGAQGRLSMRPGLARSALGRARTLYPGTPHLHCALCDVCGDYIVGLKGADDRVAVVGRRGTAAVEGAACGASNKPIFKAPGSGEMFCCPRCPEDCAGRSRVAPGPRRALSAGPPHHCHRLPTVAQ